MITIEECLEYLFRNDIEMFFIPSVYLQDELIMNTIQQYNWILMSSSLPEWSLLKKRIAYRD